MKTMHTKIAITQQQLDEVISSLLAQEAVLEAACDRCEPETKAFWYWYDARVAVSEAIEALGPWPIHRSGPWPIHRSGQ